jgi:hypothetical protein
VFAQSITRGKTFPPKIILNLNERKYWWRFVVCHPDSLLCLYRGKSLTATLKNVGLLIFFRFHKRFSSPSTPVSPVITIPEMLHIFHSPIINITQP